VKEEHRVKFCPLVGVGGRCEITGKPIYDNELWSKCFDSFPHGCFYLRNHLEGTGNLCSRFGKGDCTYAADIGQYKLRQYCLTGRFQQCPNHTTSIKENKDRYEKRTYEYPVTEKRDVETSDVKHKEECIRGKTGKRNKKLLSVTLLIQIGAFISLLMFFSAVAPTYLFDDADVVFYLFFAVVQLVSFILIYFQGIKPLSFLGLIGGFFCAFLIFVNASMADSYYISTAAAGFAYVYILGTIVAAIMAFVSSK
jgi:hypothetical protein